MRDLTELALEEARRLGADYADMRIIREREEDISIKNGVVSAVTSGETEGFGIRVLANGAWGFSSGPRLDPAEIKQVAGEAVAIARASASLKKSDVELAPVDPVEDRWETPFREDPFALKLEDKVGDLLEVDALMSGRDGIRITASQMKFRREDKTFASSHGSYIEQVLMESGAQISATSVAMLETQTRSHGNFATGGYEVIAELDLPGNAARVAEEAALLLDAEQCPAGMATVILDGPMMALQIHESCGHPTELDRVLGTEVSLAGTSFLTPDRMGSYRYGSDLVNLSADGTLPGGLGTFGYDDEGVKAQRADLVREGVFVGYMTSRETAPVIGADPNGTMRACGYNRIPLIRMTNVNLDPGDWTLDDMIADTRDGYYFQGVSSGSIDDLRINFQFGAQLGHRIKDGSITGLVKNPTYTGKTPEFWGACDAIAGPDDWRLWGVPNCGKGEPMQVAHVGHGTAPTRIRDLRIGVGKWD